MTHAEPQWSNWNTEGGTVDERELLCRGGSTCQKASYSDSPVTAKIPRPPSQTRPMVRYSSDSTLLNLTHKKTQVNITKPTRPHYLYKHMQHIKTPQITLQSVSQKARKACSSTNSSLGNA